MSLQLCLSTHHFMSFSVSEASIDPDEGSRWFADQSVQSFMNIGAQFHFWRAQEKTTRWVVASRWIEKLYNEKAGNSCPLKAMLNKAVTPFTPARWRQGLHCAAHSPLPFPCVIRLETLWPSVSRGRGNVSPSLICEPFLPEFFPHRWGQNLHSF